MRLLIFLSFSVLLNNLSAQDTLPNFQAIKKKDGTAILSWINDYGIVKQITIQRSTDSLKHFASINTLANSMTKKGEFIDLKAKLTNFYYRIFVQLPEGQYFYTPSKKAILIQNMIPVTKKDSILISIDSMQKKPKAFVPSDYIFTDKKSNIIITLPNAENKNYKILFFDETGRQVLKIPKVKESNLILEKYNFYKSGWYFFEIYENEKLYEKHKFLIAKEGASNK